MGHIAEVCFLGTIPTGKQIRGSNGCCEKGPIILPNCTSFNMLAHSSLPCVNAEGKFRGHLFCRGPEYFNEKPCLKPLITSLMASGLGWPARSSSNLCAETGVTGLNVLVCSCG